MKPINRGCVGFEIPVLHYESIEEFDKDAKKVGSALETANDHLYFHGEAAEVRSVVAEAVEAILKIARPTKPVMKDTEEKGPDGQPKKGPDGKVLQVQVTDKDGPVTEFTQSDADYVKYALAKADKTAEQLQADVLKWIQNRKDDKGQPLPPLAVSSAYVERQAPKPKVLAEKFLNTAKAVIAQGKVTQWAKDFAKIVGRPLAPEATTDATKLGWEIKLFTEIMQASALAGLTGGK